MSMSYHGSNSVVLWITLNSLLSLFFWKIYFYFIVTQNMLQYYDFFLICRKFVPSGLSNHLKGPYIFYSKIIIYRPCQWDFLACVIKTWRLGYTIWTLEMNAWLIALFTLSVIDSDASFKALIHVATLQLGNVLFSQ